MSSQPYQVRGFNVLTNAFYLRRQGYQEGFWARIVAPETRLIKIGEVVWLMELEWLEVHSELPVLVFDLSQSGDSIKKEA